MYKQVNRTMSAVYSQLVRWSLSRNERTHPPRQTASWHFISSFFTRFLRRELWTVIRNLDRQSALHFGGGAVGKALSVFVA